MRKAVSETKYAIDLSIANLFLVITTLCKVRGYKTCVKFFPHEVNDMELVTELLHFQDISTVIWQVPYILVLWLSVIVLVPFDLTTIDSGESKNQEILVKRIMNIGV